MTKALTSQYQDISDSKNDINGLTSVNSNLKVSNFNGCRPILFIPSVENICIFLYLKYLMSKTID